MAPGRRSASLLKLTAKEVEKIQLSQSGKVTGTVSKGRAESANNTDGSKMQQQKASKSSPLGAVRSNRLKGLTVPQSRNAAAPLQKGAPTLPPTAKQPTTGLSPPLPSDLPRPPQVIPRLPQHRGPIPMLPGHLMIHQLQLKSKLLLMEILLFQSENKIQLPVSKKNSKGQKTSSKPPPPPPIKKRPIREMEDELFGITKPGTNQTLLSGFRSEDETVYDEPASFVAGPAATSTPIASSSPRSGQKASSENIYTPLPRGGPLMTSTPVSTRKLPPGSSTGSHGAFMSPIAAPSKTPKAPPVDPPYKNSFDDSTYMTPLKPMANAKMTTFKGNGKK